ncbi:MAG: SRPBCC family protein, partial [Actinomycetota bacterium]|nr:SRPBCC family protein [Actinomycetota bacterium]
MQLEHTFTVPVPAAEAWTVLRDIERIAPCMPGASVDTFEDDEFRGTVKVKVGPITVDYKGSARFIELNEPQRTATIQASGEEPRGDGTARATVTARLVEQGDATQVVMTTDLAITGRPAQFGRGVMADVGNRLVGQFADCLSRELASTEAAAQPEAEPIDLVQLAGAPLLRR